ncbi:hypothetical protein HOY82DRAFT_371960 [Tuber indicum]|nr:hypothetical protein HOY82DRAFT_371960 [Tuber indicum]
MANFALKRLLLSLTTCCARVFYREAQFPLGAFRLFTVVTLPFGELYLLQITLSILQRTQGRSGKGKLEDNFSTMSTPHSADGNIRGDTIMR